MDFRRLYRDGIPLLVSKVGTIIIGFLQLVILARILTTDQMGQYSLLLMVLNLALLLGLNWSDSSIVRHGREEYTNVGKINESFWARMVIFLPMMVLFASLFIIFREQITSYIDIGTAMIFGLVTLFILNGLMNFLILLYQSTDQMKRSAYLAIVQKSLFLIVLSFLFISKASSVPLEKLIIYLNASFLLSVLISLAFFDFSKIFPAVLSLERLRVIWAYSWPQLFGFSGLYLINYVDLYFIRKYLTLGDLGVYSLAYNLFTSIGLIIMVWYTVNFPLIVEYKTKKKHAMIHGYLKRLPLYAFLFSVAIVVCLVLSRYFIPLLFSQRYAGSIAPFNVLVIASFFYFISIYLLPIVNAFDLILFSQIFNLIKAGINIYLDYVLIPKIGIMGAAYGTLISYIAGTLLTITLLYLYRKRIMASHDG